MMLEVLACLDKETTQRSIADEIGYSVGKVNYVLKKLADKGLVKAERFINSDNKSKYQYLLTSKGIKEKISITEKFIQIKKEEYDKLQENLKQYKEKYAHIDNMGGVNL
jgi:EPS-associated MarR family transcriptional regulator